MWIYFLEQVWADDMWWPSLSWRTKEYQHMFWDRWHDKGYKHQVIYEDMDHLEEGNDYIEF